MWASLLYLSRRPATSGILPTASRTTTTTSTSFRLIIKTTEAKTTMSDRRIVNRLPDAADGAADCHEGLSFAFDSSKWSPSWLPLVETTTWLVKGRLVTAWQTWIELATTIYGTKRWLIGRTTFEGSNQLGDVAHLCLLHFRHLKEPKNLAYKLKLLLS